jgi:CheY-like chemotaxis protein
MRSMNSILLVDDLRLLDIKMPRVDGFELLERLRANAVASPSSHLPRPHS